MNKTKYICVTLMMLVTSLTNLAAQDKLIYRDESINLSKSGERYQEFSFDTESRMISNFLTNPAYERIIALDSTLVKKSYLAISGNSADLKGDYKLSEGNNFNNYAIDGFGVITLKKHGTLYGHAQFSQGVDKSIGWNAIRYPEIYSPFITTDSLGGDTNYDFYNLKGGYAFNRGNWFYGVEASFKGEQAHRMSDPRLLNITSWVTAKVGAGYHTDRSTTLLSASYERNKQYQSLRYWRPGQQERVFVSKGLGLYDTQYSLVVMGYSRMYYMSRFDLNGSYKYNFNDRVSLSAGLKYDRYKVATEETSVRNLYNSTTTTISPKIELNVKGKNIDWLIYGEYNRQARKGEENIYETYLVDEVNFVYDFRLISTRHNYQQQKSNYLLQIKPTFKLSPSSNLSLIAGSYGATIDESYKIDNHKIGNEWIEPHFGVGYSLNNKKHNFDISTLYSQKYSLNNTYDVESSNNSIDYLDFQHAFAPYAFYANHYHSLKLDVSYIRHLKPLSIGVKFEAMLRDGERNSDVVYTKDIGFESSAPLISKTPDIYNEKWGRLSLFVLF